MILIPQSDRARRAVAGLVALLFAAGASAQARMGAAGSPPPDAPSADTVTVTAVDENGVAVPDARITILQGRGPALELHTDYAGRCTFQLEQNAAYSIQAGKPNFYQSQETEVDPSLRSVRIVLAHEQIVKEQVNVTASTPGLDTQQVSDDHIMNTAEIVNVPYQTSRDIRYLLPFYPGVVQDQTEQVHVDGSQTWETLDTIDGFDLRSPAEGTLDIRVSTDAVRSIEEETTRYPVEFGRATGGVIAFYTGMGDNKFRFNATNFFPSFRELNGIHFDKFVPRFTFSGPLQRDRAWWYDGVELEYDNNYVQELPPGADNNPLIRGSNLAKAQINVTENNIITAGLLFNDYHSPYEGLSSLVPQQSTTKRDILGWLPYLRDQVSFGHGLLLDVGVGEMRFRDGHEPHSGAAYEITPELPQGSYFENLTGRSSRLEGTADLYLPPRDWGGEHDLRLGIDLDHIGYNQDQVRQPVSYVDESRTLVRQSTFPQAPPFTLHNDEIGAYVEDRWRPVNGLLVDPGLRYDWDAIVRRPLLAPRVAAVYAPPHIPATTKISAGIGLYYDHTQLEYLAQPFAGIRNDTYYTNGIATSTQQTVFTANDSLLREPRALNWSVGIEQKLPGNIFGGASYIWKRTSDQFTFANVSGAAALFGDFQLTNARLDRYHAEEFDLRKLFPNGYTLYIAYTHSSARTNAALDYLPTPSVLGPQQPGPLAWNVPNRTISWGWLPFALPWFKKNWDFVYTVNWQTGFPYTAVNAAGQMVGTAGEYRFPNTINFSPGLEWRFHFRGAYYGLRGVMENATGRENPLVVNNNVDSPQFGAFSEPEGRALTARIRLIGTR